MGQITGYVNVAENPGKDKHYKTQAIQAAKDFGYGGDVVARIKAAKTDNEISRIMATARKKMSE